MATTPTTAQQPLPVPVKGSVKKSTPSWGAALGGLATQAPRATAIAADGSVYVVGYFEGETTFSPKHTLTAVGASDGFVAQFSPTGELRWVVALASPGEDSLNAVAVGPQGDVVVGGTIGGIGTFGSIASASNGSDDAFIAALSPTGEPRWVTTFGSTDSDGVNAIAVLNQRIIAGGSFRGAMTAGGQTLRPVRSTDAFLAYLSLTGAITQTVAFGERGEESVIALVPHQTDGLAALIRYSDTLVLGPKKLMSAGSETTELAITVLDAALAPTWAVSLGNEFNNIPGGLAVLPNGDLVVSGSFDYKLVLGTQTFVSKGASDVFVARLSHNGDLVWAQACGGPGEDIIYGTAANAAGEIAITGWFEGELSCAGGALVSQGGKDAFVAKLAQTGQFLEMARFGDEDHDQGRAIAFGKDGTWVVAGVFRITLNIGKYSLIQTPTVAAPRRADGFLLAMQTP